MLINFVKNHPDAKLPKFAESGATGADLYAVEDICINGTMRGFAPDVPKHISFAFIDTGLSIANFQFHPYNEREVQLGGLDIQIRMRSGLASKGLILLNGVGTIDHTYRGPIKVLAANLSYGCIEIKKGDRIAQLVVGVVYPHNEIGFRFVPETDVQKTERGTGGFGSTGK